MGFSGDFNQRLKLCLDLLMGHPKGVSPKRVMEVGLMGWGPEKGNGSGLWSCGGVVYVDGLPSSRVPEEGGHSVEGIWRGESKYGHKIRKVSSTSIKIVGKAVNSSRVKCLGLENTVDRLGEPIQNPWNGLLFLVTKYFIPFIFMTPSFNGKLHIMQLFYR